MTVKFTAGPWDYFVGNADGRGLIRIEVSGEAPKNCGQHIASMPRGAESEANARLIAAAPELLEVVEILVEAEFGDSETSYRTLLSLAAEKARRTIAKVKGRTP